jgi:carbon-monoxide dehydrogenase medium subunit
LKPPPFDYHRPESLEEVLQILAKQGADAKPLAGGQSLLPLLAMRLVRPRHIVDLQRIDELRQISVGTEHVRIGAMARQSDLEHDLRLPGLVRAAIPHIGHFPIRNRGTVGGSLSHMDPAAEWPAVALASDAVMVVASIRGRREIAAEDFMIGPQTTALAPDELLVEVVMPVHQEPFGFAEVTRRGVGDFALAGAACHNTRVVVFAATPRPQRLQAVEDLVANGRATQGQISSVARSEIRATEDFQASAEYRRWVAAELVAEVVEQARISRGESKWN